MREAISGTLVDGNLLCASAFLIAAQAVTSPLVVGQTADAMDVRVSRCQLGLFGYGDKRLGQHRIVQTLATMPPALEAALGASARDGRVTCEDLWRIAADLGLPKLTVSGGAETLKLKVVQCQLGCF